MSVCGVVMVCGRPPGHRGHHGGFRRRLAADAQFGLTAREIEFMQAYANASDMREAAYALGVSPQTAKNHCSNSYRKIGARGSVEAFRMLGWLSVPGKS